MTELVEAVITQEALYRAQVEETTRAFEIDDLYISSEESVSPWVPAGDVFLRYLSFDIRLGNITVLVKSHGPVQVARHRHRTPVIGHTIRGSWGYREYDWVARPGDYIEESPGSPHTLFSDDPEGFEALFIITGPLEYLDDEGNIISMQDNFFHINNYLLYCKENGLAVNESLFRR